MTMLSQACIFELDCPQCGVGIPVTVGWESDGDEDCVYSYLVVEYMDGKSGYNEDDEFACPSGCILTNEQVEELENVAKSEYEAPEYPAYPV
jgi:hypothetical protein